MNSTPASPASFHALGVDIGGTKIAAGLVQFPAGRVRTRRLIPTLPERGGDAVLADVERLVSELAAEARAGGEPVDGIGVGVCEIVDLDGRVASANCLAWQGVPVRERLASIAPAVIDADVRAAARAEALFGAGHGCRVFLYITVGTGIASCLVIDGEPFAGARGATGTMASGPLPRLPEMGEEHPVGSLEQYASGPALVARFNALRGQARTGHEVLAAAGAGNACALQVVRSAAGALGAGIGALVNVLDPERVILGGGLGLADGVYRTCLVEAARRHIWWPGHRELPMVSAATGPDAGLLGAAALAWHAARPR